MRRAAFGLPFAFSGAASATERDSIKAQARPGQVRAGPAGDFFEAAKNFFVGFEVPGGSYFFDLDLDMGHIQ